LCRQLGHQLRLQVGGNGRVLHRRGDLLIDRLYLVGVILRGLLGETRRYIAHTEQRNRASKRKPACAPVVRTEHRLCSYTTT
jgi:hypothetical protein